MGSLAGPHICVLVTSAMTAETFLIGFLRYLVSRGWRVSLVCSESAQLEESARAHGFEYFPVSIERNPNPLRDLHSLFSVLRQLARLKPDVAWYATPKMSLAASIAAWTARVPVRVYQQWGLRLETTRGLARALFGAAERLTALASTDIVANSASLARRIRELHLTKKPVTTLGAGSSHGVDTERFTPDAPTAPVSPETKSFLNAHEGLTVGYVGRIHPDKGIDTLLKAAHLALSGGTPVKVLFVGADEGALPLELEVPTYFVGHVSDPRPYYTAMDVLVLMSEREGFPNVVLEAAAMTVPAVVSRATGAIDSVVDGSTGYLLSVGDSEGLASIFHTFARNPELLLTLGAHARQRVVENFDQYTVWAEQESFIQARLQEAAIAVGKL